LSGLAGTSTISPQPDLGISFEEQWGFFVVDGGQTIPAQFGANYELDHFGVDGLPGNDPSRIDYTMNAGIVVPEQIQLSFPQDVLLQTIHFVDFDPQDALQLTIGDQTRHIDFASVADGLVELGDRPLAAGAMVTIAWDSSNAIGNGVSFNGLMFVAVPEPSSAVLLAAAIAGSAAWRRGKPRIGVIRRATAPAGSGS
jgi:hypothetical protein